MKLFPGETEARCSRCGCLGWHGCMSPPMSWIRRLEARVAELEAAANVPEDQRTKPVPLPFPRVESGFVTMSTGDGVPTATVDGKTYTLDEYRAKFGVSSEEWQWRVGRIRALVARVEELEAKGAG